MKKKEEEEEEEAEKQQKKKKDGRMIIFCNGSMHVFLEEEDESLIKKSIRYIPEG